MAKVQIGHRSYTEAIRQPHLRAHPNCACHSQRWSTQEFNAGFDQIFEAPEKCRGCAEWSDILTKCWAKNCVKEAA